MISERTGSKTHAEQTCFSLASSSSRRIGGMYPAMCSKIAAADSCGRPSQRNPLDAQMIDALSECQPTALVPMRDHCSVEEKINRLSFTWWELQVAYVERGVPGQGLAQLLDSLAVW